MPTETSVELCELNTHFHFGWFMSSCRYLSQQKVALQTDYTLLTCHSNLDVTEDDHGPNLKDLQACVAPARDTEIRKIPLKDCVSCVVSCCGPTSMLMLSSSAPAAYTLLPHTSGHCPLGYDFVVLFLNDQFEPGETTLRPPVVRVSQCLDLASLRTRLAWQLGAQARSSVATGEFYLCSAPQKSGLKMIPVKVEYSKEREVKRFCDEIDWYEEHQRLNYNCSDLDSQSASFNGTPIICWHEGKGNLIGISSTGDHDQLQVVTLYGIYQLLEGGPVPLFAAMTHPSPRTLSPFRWIPHLAHDTTTNKGHLLEMFHLLVEREEGSALLNLAVADPMNVSVTAMGILSKILGKFSGPEELKEVVRESHVFEPPHMSEDDFKKCILRVCKKLKGFMQHFSSVQRGTNPEKILESVFHCTDTMLHWSLQYPDVAECLLSNENVEFATKAAENYRDSQSINKSFKHIRQCRDKMVEQDLVRMRQQIATLQKELEKRELEIKQQRSHDHVELEEEKERAKRNVDRSAIPAPKMGRDQRSGSLKQQASVAGNLGAETLSASPSIKKLTMLREPGGQKVEIVASVAGKWKEIGVHLDFDDTGQHLDTIETGYEKDPLACCHAMFRHWLKGNGVENT